MTMQTSAAAGETACREVVVTMLLLCNSKPGPVGVQCACVTCYVKRNATVRNVPWSIVSYGHVRSRHDMTSQ